jgi:hypothetical protein
MIKKNGDFPLKPHGIVVWYVIGNELLTKAKSMQKVWPEYLVFEKAIGKSEWFVLT